MPVRWLTAGKELLPPSGAPAAKRVAEELKDPGLQVGQLSDPLANETTADSMMGLRTCYRTSSPTTVSQVDGDSPPSNISHLYDP